MENEQPKITIDELTGMMANGFAEMRDQFATLGNHIGDVEARLNQRIGGVEKGLQSLSYKVDQLDDKVETYRQETKDGFAGLHRVVGGISHTLADHEVRIKTLEGK